MRYRGPGNPVLFHLGLYLQIAWVILYSIPSVFVSLYHCFVEKSCKSVKGEIVLVTGSGQGLGRELCISLARLGAQLVCVDLTPDTNQETVNLIRAAGGIARGYVCDVSDRTAIHKLAQEVGRVDMLINNAGIYPIKGLWNSTEKEIRTIMDINLMSQFWTAQAFLPGMKARNHGHVVSIASIAGLLGISNLHTYSASKAGLTGLMLTLAQDMRTERKNINITTAYPFFIGTRPEICEILEENFIRVPAVHIRDATEDIIKGILQNRLSFTVPWEFGVVHNLLNMLPDFFWYHFNERFSPPVNTDKYCIEAHDNILKKETTGTFQSQG